MYGKRFNEILADLQKEGAEHGSIDLGRIIPEPEGLFMGDLGVEEMKSTRITTGTTGVSSTGIRSGMPTVLNRPHFRVIPAR